MYPNIAKYIKRWLENESTAKTKSMVFRSGGILPRDLKIYYNDVELSIVNTFSYIGKVFLTGGSFPSVTKH